MSDNNEAREYETPELIEYGDVSRETHGVQDPPSDIIIRN